MLWVRRVAGAALVLLLSAGPASAQVVFNELLIRRDNTHTDQAIELKNTYPGSIDIGGWLVWHAGTWSILPQNFILQSGGMVVLHFNQGGSNSQSDIYFPDDELEDVSDLALYAANTLSNYGFTNSSNIRSFIQWGGIPSGGQQSVAASAGLWTSRTYLPAPTIGHSFELCSGFGTSPTSYVDQSSPTIGIGNACHVEVEAVTWGRVKSIFH